MGLQTIARFHDFHEAWALRCRLEAHGIESFCPEEKFVLGNWGHLFASEGLRIQVAASDTERATSIVETPGESLPVPSECCPDCGSENTVLRETERNIVTVIFWMLHLLIPFRDRLVCLDCKAGKKDGDPAAQEAPPPPANADAEQGVGE